LRVGAGAPAWFLGGACLLLAAAAGAQQPPELVTGDFTDSTEASWVLVPVTVRDGRGRLVSNLEQKLFHVAVDGIEFPIRSFWREGGLPIALAFVLDTSGSMGYRRTGMARDEILAFVSQLGPKDEVSLITFGAGEVMRRLPFGTDAGLLRRILEPLHGFGTTALYDMLTVAPTIMDGAHHLRRATLFFTDGVDTASQLSAADALTVLESLKDPLYVFGMEPPPRVETAEESYESLLTRFAAATGGRYIRAANLAELPRLGRELRRELTMRYIIAIEPSRVGTAKQRSITVRVDGRFIVNARESYRGTLP
jgi:VWFA-related protein